MRNFKFLLLLLLFFNLQCDRKQTKNGKFLKEKTVRDSIRDIYIGKTVYAGGELYDFVIEKYGHFKNVDSLAYVMYRNDDTKSKDCIFSLERFVQNTDVEEYLVIDTLVLKNYRRENFKLVEKDSLNKVIVSVYSGKVNLKTWIFNKKKRLQATLSIASSWRISCNNTLTILDISNRNAGYLSLYSQNPIYIDVDIRKNDADENRYEIRFKSIDSQNIHYKDKKTLIEEDISKTIPIGTFTVDRDKLILQWLGLYNEQTKNRDFLDDALFIKENGGNNPVVFKRCDE